MGLGNPRHVIQSPEHRDSLKLQAELCRVIIEYAYRAPALIAPQIPQQGCPGSSRAHHDHRLRIELARRKQMPVFPRPIQEPAPAHDQYQEQGMQDQNGTWHIGEALQHQ